MKAWGVSTLKGETMVRRIGLFFLTIAVLMSVMPMNSQAQSLSTRHVREAIRTGEAKPTGLLPSDQIMNLDVVLPVRDQAALDSFLQELYDPASPSYRHFLTVPEFTERFGPTQADYDAVVRFAETHGFTVVGGSRDGMDVQIRGPVSAVEAAFHVSMRNYQHPTEGRTFYAPDREPTTDLPFQLWHISGLDNYSIPHPLFVRKSDYAKAHGIDARDVVSHATTGSGPSASFLGSDMRAAYYGGTALTGAGQNLGLFEYEGTDLADLTTYFKNVGQTNNVPVTLLSTDGTSTSCTAASGCDDTEQTLDMTQALGMAPKPGGVHRIHRHRNHQRDDHAQPAAHHDWLFVGLDAGRSKHAQPLLPEDGGSGPELLRRFGRQFHVVVEE
jgi:subtilase family serine protease